MLDDLPIELWDYFGAYLGPLELVLLATVSRACRRGVGAATAAPTRTLGTRLRAYATELWPSYHERGDASPFQRPPDGHHLRAHVTELAAVRGGGDLLRALAAEGIARPPEAERQALVACWWRGEAAPRLAANEWEAAAGCFVFSWPAMLSAALAGRFCEYAQGCGLLAKLYGSSHSLPVWAIREGETQWDALHYIHGTPLGGAHEGSTSAEAMRKIPQWEALGYAARRGRRETAAVDQLKVALDVALRLGTERRDALAARRMVKRGASAATIDARDVGGVKNMCRSVVSARLSVTAVERAIGPPLEMAMELTVDPSFVLRAIRRGCSAAASPLLAVASPRLHDDDYVTELQDGQVGAAVWNAPLFDYVERGATGADLDALEALAANFSRELREEAATIATAAAEMRNESVLQWMLRRRDLPADVVGRVRAALASLQLPTIPPARPSS